MALPDQQIVKSQWNLGTLQLHQLVVRAVHGFREHHLDARSAQFAYYAMLFIAPLLILLIAAFAQLPLEGEIESLTETAGRTLPTGADSVLLRQIEDIQKHSTLSLVLFALVVAGFAGSQLFLTISRGLNAAYGVTEVRRDWQVRCLALLVTLGAFIMLLVALLLLLLGPVITHWLAEHSFDPRLGFLLNRGYRWLILGLVTLTSASVIYWLAPGIKVRWSLFTPGSLFATLGWAITGRGFQFYVETIARYNETYGVIGGTIILLVWLYLTGAVLMMGGQINSIIYLQHQRATTDSVTAPIRSTAGNHTGSS
ncbi:MAG: YihY/virulence factor BrkB family protein [Planctomycetota bacterium]|nr:YihY/virulence factor BrkB family protein [Planctomycetota bacterium]